MRYVQLRAFHNVAIHGGFSRAAEALHLTQPAVSDQVRKLEEEYDIVLFNRYKKRVMLTEAGRRLLDITHRLFETERQAAELLLQSRALRSGQLRVIADSAHHLLHVLTRFRAQYPGIAINIRSGNSEEVVEKLHAYEADIGVLAEFPAGRDFANVRLGSTPIIAFVGRDHPLAGRPEVTVEELCRHPLVLREQGSRTRLSLETAAAERGLKLVVAVEAEGREAVRELVAAGAGAGVVSEAEFVAEDRLLAIPLADCRIMMDEALICLRERAGGKLVRAFLDLAREVSGKPKPRG